MRSVNVGGRLLLLTKSDLRLLIQYPKRLAKSLEVVRGHFKPQVLLRSGSPFLVAVLSD